MTPSSTAARQSPHQHAADFGNWARLVSRISDKKILILLLRLRTETASDMLSHARQARPGAHSACLSSEAVKSVRKPKHQPLATFMTMTTRRVAAEPVSAVCNLRRPGFSHDLVIASGILRRLVELLSRRARCRVGFPAWQTCPARRWSLGQSKLSQNSSPFDSCAPQGLI